MTLALVHGRLDLGRGFGGSGSEARLEWRRGHRRHRAGAAQRCTVSGGCGRSV